MDLFYYAPLFNRLGFVCHFRFPIAEKYMKSSAMTAVEQGKDLMMGLQRTVQNAGGSSAWRKVRIASVFFLQTEDTQNPDFRYADSAA